MKAAISHTEFAALFEPLQPASPFAVAVSGGADSMALLLLAHEWATANNAHMIALTVDHRLRKESTAEARQVKRWLDARGIEHHTLTWKHGKLSGNKQEKARDARYGLLGKWCAAHGVRQLLVAHHADDQAETLLLRLKRGSHVEGLSAMRAATELHGLTLLRPLLSLPKARLLATLEARGQKWIEDPSNADDAYDRARLRRLLSALPNRDRIIAQLAATAAALGRLRSSRENETQAFLSRHVQWLPQGASCDAQAFAQAPPDLALRALLAMLAHVSHAPHPPRFLSLERLHLALTGQERARRTLHGCLIERRRGQLLIRPEHRRQA